MTIVSAKIIGFKRLSMSLRQRVGAYSVECGYAVGTDCQREIWLLDFRLSSMLPLIVPFDIPCLNISRIEPFIELGQLQTPITST